MILCSSVSSLTLLGVSSVWLGTVLAAPNTRTAQLDARQLQPITSRQVLELDIPVTTVDAQGDLVLTDGSGYVEILQEKAHLCKQTLLEHSFATSYGVPGVAQYTPPSCNYNRITWNLTVTSNGTQYDRLGTVWLGDIEVLRTSTAEPLGGAISWTYLKDMTPYISLLEKDQKIIVDLGNIVTATNAASYDVTLSATYYTDEDSANAADLIIPISKRLSSQDLPSAFSAPSDDATNTIILPRNVRKAVFTIAATGQDTEEFWWSNVPSSDVNALPDYGPLYGFSPFREVQLFIDGSIAGVAWPFPTLFSGALISAMWSPIVGIDIFDLRETEIDLMPWLPLLCDGKTHEFRLSLTGLTNENGTIKESGTVGNSWLLSGKIFVWYDEEGHVTNGTKPNISAPPLDVQIITTGSGGSGSTAKLFYEVHVKRELQIVSTVKTSNSSEPAFWRQSLDFSNNGNYTNGGQNEETQQQTNGIETSSSGYSRRFEYPLHSNTTHASTSRGLRISGLINHGKSLNVVGSSVFQTDGAILSTINKRNGSVLGTVMKTYQNASGLYTSDVRARTSTTSTTNEQDLSLSGLAGPKNLVPLLSRHAKAINGSLVSAMREVSAFTRTSAFAHTIAQPPRLPGRGYKGRHISEFAGNVTVSD